MNRKILLVSSGLVHPNLYARRRLQRSLAQIPGFDLQCTGSLEDLTDLDLHAPHALVLYVHHKKVSPAALVALEQFVDRGGGLLALHSASASYKGETRYFNLLGGRFDHHGPIQTFTVEPADRLDPVFPRIEPFTVRDERYMHETGPDIQVRFTSPLPDGSREPVVWTRQHGNGRVCYCSLGHTASSMGHPQVREVLRCGLSWVCQPRQEAAHP